MFLSRSFKQIAMRLCFLILASFNFTNVLAQPAASTPTLGSTQSKDAGRVLMSIGDVKISRQGQIIAVVRGTIVESGDSVTTGVASNVQFRMIDGAVIALRAQTEFKIDEYSYNGKEDGSEKAMLSLVKGGVRAVTGVIGHENKDNLQVNAVVATVGIRGTGFNLNYCQDSCLNLDKSQAKNGLYAGVFEGKISVKNASAEGVLGVNQFFYVANQNSSPVRLLQPPTFLPDPLAGQRSAPRGKKASIPSLTVAVDAPAGLPSNEVVIPPLSSLPTIGQIAIPVPPYLGAATSNPFAPLVWYNLPAQGDGNAPSSAAGFAYYLQKAETWPQGPVGVDGLPPHNVFSDSNPRAGPASPNGMAITTSGSGQSSYVSQINLSNPPYFVSGTSLSMIYSIGTARQIEGGNFGGVVSWGRWADGDVQQIAGYNAGSSFNVPLDSGFHYIVGEWTNAVSLNSLAATNSVLSFNLIGGTTPTAVGASLGTWLISSGNMTADFASRAINGNLGLYNNQPAGYAFYNMAFNGGLSTTSPSNNVTGTVSKVSGSLALCATGCPSAGNIVFYGNATPAQAAGFSYNFSTGSNIVQGVAVFKR